MPIGSDIGAVLPEPGPGGDSPAVAAARIVDTLERLVEAVEGQVPSGAIDVIAEMDFQAQGVTGLAHAGLDNLADSNGNDPGELLRFGDDLHWVHPAGVVKITDGTGLNAAAIGGIGGDYGSGDEIVSYDNVTDIYSFLDDDDPVDWSKVKVDGVVLVRSNSYAVTVSASSAPPVDQNLKFGNVYAPASKTLPLRVDADGNVEASGTLSGDLALSGTVTFSGNVVRNGRHRTVTPSSGHAVTAGGWAYVNMGVQSLASGTSGLVVPIEVATGDRIKQFQFLLAGDGANSMSIEAFYVNTAGTRVSMGSVTPTNIGAPGYTLLDVTDHVFLVGQGCHVIFTPSEAGMQVGPFLVEYDITGP